MPVYQIIIEIEDESNPNHMINHVEYIESKSLIDATNKADKNATIMDGELKSVRYATPTPIKI